MNCDNCEAFPDDLLTVKSASLSNLEYKLCPSCTFGLFGTKYPHIKKYQVSKNTVDKFRELFNRSITPKIDEAYAAASVYNEQVTKCQVCSKPQYSTLFDPDNSIRSILRINYDTKFVCHDCISNILH